MLSKQLLRSGTSVGALVREAEQAESRNDFIHKMKIILKELRESMISLKIIEKRAMYDLNQITAAKGECNQLIAIFVKSIETAKKNNTK